MDHLVFFLNPHVDRDTSQSTHCRTDFRVPASRVRCYVHDRETYHVDDFYKIAGIGLGNLKLFGSRSTEDKLSFLQSWLFFALLSFFLCKDISVGDFVINRSQFITTRRLPHLLSVWRDEMEMADSKPRRGSVSVDNALLVAYGFISTWYNEDGSDGVPPELWQSLAIIGETLCHARGLYRWNADEINIRSWGNNKGIAENMIGKGWCKHAVSMLEQSMTNLSGLYVASLLMPPPGHGTCTEKRCQPSANYRDSGPSHTKHCTSECVLLEIDFSRIEESLDSGAIPLLSLRKKRTKTNDKTIFEDFVDVQCVTEVPCTFVAISHVWSDGLGNKSANSLPYCQISELQDMVNGMCPEEAKQGPVPFWLDTLCIPLEPKHKILGIQGMARVYRLASAVLVLDNDLRCFGQYNGLEPLIRINMSKWVRRLWTLQEGSLSKSLFFKFDSETLLSSKEIEQRLHIAEKYNKHLPWLRMTQIFNPSIRSLQEPSLRNQIAHLWRAVQWRTTQDEKDETICLSSLLDMDLAPLLNEEDSAENRMCHFINQLSQRSPGIPQGMIFLPGHKLSREGFRWAPKSWMIGQSQDCYMIHLLEEDVKPAALHTAGLRVKYPGIKLHFESVPRNSGFYFTNQNQTIWYRLRYPSEAERYGSREPPWLGTPSQKLPPPMWLILSRSKLGPSPDVALLVIQKSILTNSDGKNMLHYVNRISIVWINILVDPDEIHEAKSRYRAREEDRVWGDMYERLTWCIDAEVVSLPQRHPHALDLSKDARTAKTVKFDQSKAEVFSVQGHSSLSQRQIQSAERQTRNSTRIPRKISR
jgi:hypothetical protein